MLVETIGDDPRLAIFRDLRGQRHEGYFVCEGRLVVERLLGSPWETVALLIAERKRPWLEKVPRLPPETPVYVIPDSEIDSLVGFQFHSGILAAGRRDQPQVLSDGVAAWRLPHTSGTLLACPHLDLEENLGSILRSVRALGGNGILVDHRAPDPLSRRVLRVSMGHSMSVPILRADDLATAIAELKVEGYRGIAMEAAPEMTPLREAVVGERQLLILGNEFAGIPSTLQELADETVGIPMATEVDSLNVAVTAALALHHYCR